MINNLFLDYTNLYLEREKVIVENKIKEDKNLQIRNSNRAKGLIVKPKSETPYFISKLKRKTNNNIKSPNNYKNNINNSYKLNKINSPKIKIINTNNTYKTEHNLNTENDDIPQSHYIANYTTNNEIQGKCSTITTTADLEKQYEKSIERYIPTEINNDIIYNTNSINFKKTQDQRYNVYLHKKSNSKLNTRGYSSQAREIIDIENNNKDVNVSNKISKKIHNASVSMVDSIKHKINNIFDERNYNNISIEEISSNKELDSYKMVNDKINHIANDNVTYLEIIVDKVDRSIQPKRIEKSKVINFPQIHQMKSENNNRLKVKSFDLKEKRHVPPHFLNKFNLNYLINRNNTNN